MKIETLQREFSYNGAKLADPAPTFTLQQVRDFYSQTYPELTNAEIEGPVVKGNRNIYTFRRAVGTKGGDPFVDVRVQIDAILDHGRAVPAQIRSYLLEVDRFSAAHVCPLLDAEITFIRALFVHYGSAV